MGCRLPQGHKGYTESTNPYSSQVLYLQIVEIRATFHTLHILKTYETIASAKRVFPTANHPILVSCNDDELRLWVVKSCRGKLPAYGLAKELIAYRFAEIWELHQPKAALIRVNPGHLEKLGVDKALYELCPVSGVNTP
jgi:hypothetical protein